MKSCLDVKTFLKLFFIAGLFILAMRANGIAGPCASSLPFSNVISFDRLANGQIISQEDCNEDGVVDFRTTWTVVEYIQAPLACQDPYDSRHLIVPQSGYYRVFAEPVQVVISLEREKGIGKEFPSFQKGGRW